MLRKAKRFYVINIEFDKTTLLHLFQKHLLGDGQRIDILIVTKDFKMNKSGPCTEVNPHKHSYLMLDKGIKNIHWRKELFK